MEVLNVASKLSLTDWCVAAGFVRNIVWDKIHGFVKPTPLNDIDLIYFDQSNMDPDQDKKYETILKTWSDHPWSVKNQARMHIRNDDMPYASTSDAMSYWVEVETAIGASLSKDGEILLNAPFGLDALFSNTITLNQKRIKRDAFKQRLESKMWLQQWPKLKVDYSGKIL
ncbi:MAG: nucleotidyltransferase family protein [Kordiimonadaceae bacterium]|nr:nucleotidyltransferase family protein [Kordiimonadaceae bacterium]MBT6031091.1 nucleotidyltransferase family protein [Kordiimonadaceae bacterium]